MAETSLVVIMSLVAWHGKQESLKEILCSLLEPTLKEKGCMRYELLENIADEKKLVLSEEWATLEDYEAHKGSPHIKSAIPKAMSLLASAPSILVYRKLKQQK